MLWKYRDQLSKSGCMDELFGMFKDQLWARGYELTRRTDCRFIDSVGTGATQQPRGKYQDQRRRGSGGLGSEAEQAASKRC